MLKKLLSLLPEPLRNELMNELYVRQLFSVFLMQIYSLTFSMLFTFLIARWLGAAAYGAYSFGFSWANLLAVFGCLGLEQLALREVPAYLSKNNPGLLRGLFRFSNVRVIIASVLFILIIYAGSFLLHLPKDDVLKQGLWLALPVTPFIAMINLRAAWLRSFQLQAKSQLPDKVLRPSLLLLGGIIAYVFFRNETSYPQIIMLAIAAIIIAWMLNNWFLQKAMIAVKKDQTIEQNRSWMKMAFSLWLVNAFIYYLSQVQILILGNLKDAKETAVFTLSSRLTDLEGYLLFAFNVVMTPLIAKLYAENKKKELQQIFSRGLWIGFLFSAPLIVVMITAPQFILGLFGKDFPEGREALIVLSIAQLVNYATGSAGYLLTMTGNQKTAITLLAIASVFSTALSFILINNFGKNGAALASAIVIILLNVAMSRAVYRKTGINSTLLSRL